MTLPKPDGADKEISRELGERIRHSIRVAGGSIGFDAYVEQALYTPELGYYSSNRTRFGAVGDFVTAPEISSLFSQCLARQAAEVFAGLDSKPHQILEVGAGSGVMARDLIGALDHLCASPDQYLILERSAGARAQQRQTLGVLAERVQWLDDFPEHGICGLVVANELLDALPGVRFIMTDNGPEELRVACREGELCWQQRAFTDTGILQELTGRLAQCDPLPLGYVSEYVPAQAAWVRTMAEHLRGGVLLLIDYGYPCREFYHPQRGSGTLACYYRHHMHEDPFWYPGLEDISVHVDFTSVAQAGLAAGLYLLGYTTQAHFLLAGGLLDLLSTLAEQDSRNQAEMSAQVQRLTLPSELGELVKVMALSPDPDLELSGFSGRDFSSRL